jgi:phage terminase large subunit-like protein
MTTWDPASSDESPDRVDALVWALTELVLSDPSPLNANHVIGLN